MGVINRLLWLLIGSLPSTWKVAIPTSNISSKKTIRETLRDVKRCTQSRYHHQYFYADQRCISKKSLKSPNSDKKVRPSFTTSERIGEYIVYCSSLSLPLAQRNIPIYRASFYYPKGFFKLSLKTFDKKRFLWVNSTAIVNH